MNGWVGGTFTCSMRCLPLLGCLEGDLVHRGLGGPRNLRMRAWDLGQAVLLLGWVGGWVGQNEVLDFLGLVVGCVERSRRFE